MDEREAVKARLTLGKAAEAYAFASRLAAESREDGRWYGYIDVFAELLGHKSSLVRNRAITLIAANAVWDAENRYDALMDELLKHITDEKPITARQCVKALPEIAGARPDLAPRMLAALEKADVSGYKDSMRPLVLKDIADAVGKIRGISNGAENL